MLIRTLRYEAMKDGTLSLQLRFDSCSVRAGGVDNEKEPQDQPCRGKGKEPISCLRMPSYQLGKGCSVSLQCWGSNSAMVGDLRAYCPILSRQLTRSTPGRSIASCTREHRLQSSVASRDARLCRRDHSHIIDRCSMLTMRMPSLIWHLVASFRLRLDSRRGRTCLTGSALRARCSKL